MNASFNRLELVNYLRGVRQRRESPPEIVFEGTSDAAPDESARLARSTSSCASRETPLRRPWPIAPYQPRIDWQIWFAAMSSPLASTPGLLHLIAKLLRNDPAALALLDGNPFPDAPPRYIRAVLYRYQFAPPGNPRHAWWDAGADRHLDSSPRGG
jgi:hypothetical protein